MQQIIWEVEPTSPWAARRYCQKCGVVRAFTCTERFRINAQKRYLDIWLIYRCSHCKRTWNLPLFSRVNPQALAPKLYQKLLDNDAALARHYASYAALLQKQGAELLPPQYRVTGPRIPPGRPIELVLRCPYPLPIKLAALLRQQLGLSRRAWDLALAAGDICVTDERDLAKCRIEDGLRLLLRRSGSNPASAAYD